MGDILHICGKAEGDNCKEFVGGGLDAKMAAITILVLEIAMADGNYHLVYVQLEISCTYDY